MTWNPSLMNNRDLIEEITVPIMMAINGSMMKFTVLHLSVRYYCRRFFLFLNFFEYFSKRPSFGPIFED